MNKNRGSLAGVIKRQIVKEVTFVTNPPQYTKIIIIPQPSIYLNNKNNKNKNFLNFIGLTQISGSPEIFLYKQYIFFSS